MADTVLSWMPLEIIEDVWACCLDLPPLLSALIPF